MKNDNHSDVNRRTFVKGSLGTAAVIGLAGCLGDDADDADDAAAPADDGDDAAAPADDGDDADDTEDVPRDQKLFIGQSQAPVHFDPVEQMDVHSQFIGLQIYTNLYTFDEGLGLVPSELTVDLPEVERDGERYIVEIVDYAEFHNGDPVTAEDVQYTVEQPLVEESRMMESFEMVESTEIVDDTTVQFDLDQPYGAFPVNLAHQVTPKAVREDDLDTFRNEMPIGSGPYRFVDWQQGEYALIERWDDYWGDLDPHIQEIEFVPLEEDSTRITTLETGENDMIEGIPASLWDTVEGIADAEIHTSESMNYNYFVFNLNEGPTADIRVREAIDHCIDIDQAVENFVEPAGARMYSPANPAWQEEWDFPQEEWEEYHLPRDIDRAQELFAEADVPDDYEFTIICPPDDVREDISVSMANGIDEAGYEAQVQRLGWDTFIDQFVSGDENDYNVYILGRSSTPNLPRLLSSLWSIEVSGINNGLYYGDEEFEDMMRQAAREPEYDAQRDLMIRIIEHALEQKLHLPVHGNLNSWAAKEYVHDIQIHPVAQYNPRMVSDYNNMWMEP